ncbi:TonB-dependent receptor [Exilibacterium tricleocarpae]|uniref:TonB-dependent receptor n=1 Tax=Exilibacterium tricleocarpae TaxID=2591008 RepID=A0A545TVL0_9GAMM|nr:TonB-dependent receptor [Exilibacterium tricleocarpae]TQV81256.1 TonB-dependent receptor [Exilibacterium tricleocarpae]
MNISRKRVSVAVGAVIGIQLAAGIGAPALAQGDEQAENLLEEIVVTSRKRSESLQEVPLAISAFSAADIQANGMMDIRDIANATPGLTYGAEFGRAAERPTIRGMSNTATAIEQPVAVFIDGVYQTTSVLATSLSDLERVEVVKGPQSALYGRSTFGGAINYVRRRPDNEMDARLSVSAGEDNYEAYLGGVSGAIIADTLYFRAGFDVNSVDGQYRDPDSSYLFGSEETDSFTLGIVYAATEDLEFILNYGNESVDDSLFAGRNISSPANACELGGTVTWWCGELPANDAGPVSADTDLLGGKAGTARDTERWDLTVNYLLPNAMEMTAIVARTDIQQRLGNDQTYSSTEVDGMPDVGGVFVPGGPNPGFYIRGAEDWNSLSWGDTEFNSAELRLASAAEQRLRWMLGLYYYDEKELDASAGGAGPSFSLERPAYDPASNRKGEAVFAWTEYDIDDRMTLSAEVRVLTEEYSTVLVAPLNGSENIDEDWDETTARVSVSYSLIEEVTLYGSVATGFKAGGVNNSATVIAQAPELVAYDPDTVTTYELGVKSDLLDNRLRVNAAVYYNDWEEQQLSTAVISNQGNVVSAITNVGNTDIYGLDLDITWLPIEGLELSLAYAYVDAEIQEGIDARRHFSAYGDSDIAGFEPPFVADHQYTLTAAYRRALLNTGFDFYANTNYSYTDDGRYLQIQNTMDLGEAKILNARIGLSNEHWDIAFWGRNLTDNDNAISGIRYVDTNVLSQTFATVRQPVALFGKKRQVGATVTYHF